MTIQTSPVRKSERWLLGVLVGPSALYLLIFFIIPLFIVAVYSFLSRGTYGQLVWKFTLSNYIRVFDKLYLSILWNSIVIAIITTIICLIVSYPFAYAIARNPSERRRNILLILVMIPFWTNFLIRTYAWRVILGTDGPLNGLLLGLGIIKEPLPLIFNNGAVMLGLVYGYLPFMVLPLYAAIERIDFSLVEAAHDLYADGRAAFLRVVLPLSMPGILAGSILVFIPSFGTFVTSDILGGGKTVLIGNLIQSQFLTARDWPFGSAFSVLLMIAVLGATLLYFRKGGRSA